MDARLANDLGVSLNPWGSSALDNSVAVLTDPLERTDFGVSCYFGGAAPSGRMALRALVQARSIILLELALRGANPEGRVYAAEGLARLGALTNADLRVIENLAATGVDVQECDGCIVTLTSARKLLERAVTIEDVEP